MGKPICTAVRNGETDSFCTDTEGGGELECYAFWGNMQQFPCPWVEDNGEITINLLVKNPTDETLQALAARIFGESPRPEGAPDTLESLENLLVSALEWADSVQYDRDVSWDYNAEPAIVAARAAIAKARGET